MQHKGYICCLTTSNHNSLKTFSLRRNQPSPVPVIICVKVPLIKLAPDYVRCWCLEWYYRQKKSNVFVSTTQLMLVLVSVGDECIWFILSKVSITWHRVFRDIGRFTKFANTNIFLTFIGGAQSIVRIPSMTSNKTYLLITTSLAFMLGSAIARRNILNLTVFTQCTLTVFAKCFLSLMLAPADTKEWPKIKTFTWSLQYHITSSLNQTLLLGTVLGISEVP